MLHMSEQREFWIETYSIQVVTLMNTKRQCTSPNTVNTQLYDFCFAHFQTSINYPSINAECFRC